MLVDTGKSGGKRKRDVTQITSASYTATGIVWSMSATSTPLFVPFIPSEASISYTYWSQDEEEPGNYNFITNLYGIKEDGTEVLIDSFTVSDRWGNASGSTTRTLNTSEEFVKIRIASGTGWKYRSGSKLSFTITKGTVIV
jgi:hypothetical protein